jgi:hypothetical protein
MGKREKSQLWLPHVPVPPELVYPWVFVGELLGRVEGKLGGRIDVRKLSCGHELRRPAFQPVTTKARCRECPPLAVPEEPPKSKRAPKRLEEEAFAAAVVVRGHRGRNTHLVTFGRLDSGEIVERDGVELLRVELIDELLAVCSASVAIKAPGFFDLERAVTGIPSCKVCAQWHAASLPRPRGVAA